MAGLIRQFFTQFSRRTDLYLGGLLLLVFGAGLYLKFLQPTVFLSSIRERLLANRELMALIGGANGYEMRSADKAAIPRTFRVTIKGHCPGTSLTVRGIYTDTSFTITDTLVAKCPGSEPPSH